MNEIKLNAVEKRLLTVSQLSIVYAYKTCLKTSLHFQFDLHRSFEYLGFIGFIGLYIYVKLILLVRFKLLLSNYNYFASTIFWRWVPENVEIQRVSVQFHLFNGFKMLSFTINMGYHNWNKTDLTFTVFVFKCFKVKLRL